MNTEKINAAAEKASSGYTHPEAGAGIYHGFIKGITYAAANPDVIGCCTIEDAMGFAEWLVDPECYWMNAGDAWYKKLLTVGYERKTTSALFQIYQQQKQQG